MCVYVWIYVYLYGLIYVFDVMFLQNYLYGYLYDKIYTVLFYDGTTLYDFKIWYSVCIYLNVYGYYGILYMHLVML